MKGGIALTKFEKELLRFVFSKTRNDFINHIDHLIVCNRDHTGVGQYVEFEYAGQSLFPEKDTTTVGSNVLIELAELKYGAGCLVYIVNGHIEELELFTHAEEEFPLEITTFKINDSSEKTGS